MSDGRNKTLIVVEGKSEKEKLINHLAYCFPESGLNPEKILIYGADIYDLYDRIIEEYDEDWFSNGSEINIPYLISLRESIEPKLKRTDFTNIILVFDYEHHAPNFDYDKIWHLQDHFKNMTDEGVLYINYPMFEAYLMILANLGQRSCNSRTTFPKYTDSVLVLSGQETLSQRDKLTS